MLEVGHNVLTGKVVQLELVVKSDMLFINQKVAALLLGIIRFKIRDKKGLKIVMTHFWPKGQRAGTNHQET
jgi:hypothetical protein